MTLISVGSYASAVGHYIGNIGLLMNGMKEVRIGT
jgi:hypothetical protein